ncbi:hypothetical protein EJB05_32896, partial [Eragrostis curvula]
MISKSLILLMTSSRRRRRSRCTARTRRRNQQTAPTTRIIRGGKRKKKRDKESDTEDKEEKSKEERKEENGLAVRAYDRDGRWYDVRWRYLASNTAYRIIGSGWRSFLQDNSKQQHFSPEIELWTFRSRKLELGYKDGHPQGALGLVLLHNNPQADQEPPAATTAHIIVGQDNPPHDDIMEVPGLPAADDDENADKASNKPDEAAPRSTRQERLTPLEVLLAQSMLLFKPRLVSSRRRRRPRMSGPDPGTPGWTRSSASAAAARNAKAERRVPLGDFTNVCGGGRFGAADAEEEVNDGTKLKSFHTDIEWLNKRLREEEGRRIRAEAQHSKLQDRVQQLELQLASYTTLLGHKPHGSCCVNLPQQLVDLEKQASTNLNKNGDATLVKEKAESATEEFDGVSEEKDRSREDHIMLTKQEPRDGDGSSLKQEMLSDQGQMDVVGKLERIIDEMNEIITQQCSKLDKMNDRLSIERRKVISLERERDQLRSQVESKLGYGDYSVTDTEVPQMVNTLAVDCEEKPEVQKPSEWLQAVEELKGQGGSAKKQPILIEICDDEETSMWCDGDINPSNPSSSGELGAESWFFRGNKLMLSSGMKKHLKEICGFVPPEIPFYIYQMNKSSLKRKGRMRLSAKYTSAHLRSCFHKKEGCIRFEVDGEECGTVKINLLEDGRASLSSGWEGVVEAKSMKVGDICAFQFKVSDDDLKLAIHMFHVARYLVSLK